jgi:hypothetical protein
MQSIESREKMKNKIEAMEKYYQIEILKILTKRQSKINENKSGCYVNLTFLPQETIDELMEYIDYTKEQEEAFNTMEYQKEEFKLAFFYEKENKDETPVIYNNLTTSK